MSAPQLFNIKSISSAPKQSFLDSLGSAASKAIAPPIANAQSNFTNNFGTPSSTPGATPAKPAVIGTPAAQKFISALQAGAAAKSPGAAPGSSTPPPTTGNTGTTTTSTTGTSTGGTSTPTPTPTPQNAPQAPSATDTAFAAYIKSLQPDDSVTGAKTAYNDYVANQKKSISGLSGQGRGIPLTLIKGEQEKLLNQTQPEATRLQNEISIAQDSQKSVQTATKANADYLQGKDTTAYNQSQDKIKNDQADRKFEEDKRQYGLDYALKAKELAIKQQEADQKNPNSDTSKAASQSDATSSINLINTLLNNPKVLSIAGSIDNLKIAHPDILANSDTKVAKNQYNQLKGLLSLENRSKLKGQGAVSDFEGKTLDLAASSLSRSLSNAEFVNQLKQVRGSIATSHGLPATVTIKDPHTGQSTTVQADSAGISQAVKDGLLVSYD